MKHLGLIIVSRGDWIIQSWSKSSGREEKIKAPKKKRKKRREASDGSLKAIKHTSNWIYRVHTLYTMQPIYQTLYLCSSTHADPRGPSLGWKRTCAEKSWWKHTLTGCCALLLRGLPQSAALQPAAFILHQLLPAVGQPWAGLRQAQPQRRSVHASSYILHENKKRQKLHTFYIFGAKSKEGILRLCIKVEEGVRKEKKRQNIRHHSFFSSYSSSNSLLFVDEMWNIHNAFLFFPISFFSLKVHKLQVRNAARNNL